MEENQYVIISKTAIQKRIEELENLLEDEPNPFINTDYNAELNTLKQILSQSTPLIPEIEKAFLAGRSVDNIDSIDVIKPTYFQSEDYISNLKINL